MTPMQPPEIQEGWQAKKSKHKEKKPPREKRKKKNKYDDFDDDVVEKGTYDPSEVLRREIEEATDKEWKRRKRERVELSKKEKQQAARKKKMQDPSKKSGNGCKCSSSRASLRHTRLRPDDCRLPAASKRPTR